MAKKPTTPAKPDPFAELGIGLAADHKAAKAKEAANPEPEAPPASEAVVDNTPSAELAPEADTAPPSPGDNREAVFERRLDRLTRTIEFAEIEGKTVFGDLMELFTNLYQHRPMAWSELIPTERNDFRRWMQNHIRPIVRKMAIVMAIDESETVQATLLGQFNVKGDAIEAKIKIDNADDDTFLAVRKMAGTRIVLVSADDKRFQSARRDIPDEDDQIAMTFADDKPKAETPPADPPADDSDLAGEDPKPEAEDEPFEERNPELHLVFDKSSGEYLIDEDGGEDGWTDKVADAGKWPLGTATDLARGFGSDDGLVVTVPVEEIPAEVAQGEPERTHDDTSAIND